MGKPEIRFKEFTDDWEQRKLGEIGEVITGSTPSTQHPEYYSEDGMPWVTPTDIVDNIIYDTPRKLSPIGEKVGRVVPADTILVTCIASIGKNAMLVNTGSFNQQINGLVPDKKKYDPYFLLTESFHWSAKMKREAAAGTMQIVNKNEFSAIETYVPELSEQKVIGAYFCQIDKLITLHQRKCDEVKTLKKYMLQKMFPQNGMNIPEIRFSGFTDVWEQRKFGELVEKYEDPVETPTEGYMRLGIRSHAKGTFHSYVEKGKELEAAKMFRVAADKFIVNITFGWEHAVAITDENDAGKLVSHRFPQYSFIEGMIPKFFRYLILDENFKHHLELSSPGGAGRNRVLKLSDMLEYKMSYPGSEEQKKIAKFFDNLDHLITLHQRKCDELRKMKKFMLQNMFPKE